jgi:hypothetical protein
LHGPQQAYGVDKRHFAYSLEGLSPLIGAHRLLLDCGENFAISAEDFLAANLSTCKMVILPEMAAIDEITEKALLQFVWKGGTLLIVGRLPQVNGQPIIWAGLQRQEEQPWQDHIYLPGWPGHESAVLVRGDFYKLRLQGAKRLLPAIQPYDCTYGVKFGWGVGPASSSPSPFPALARMNLQRGTVWYLEAPIFSDYAQHANWNQQKWFKQLLKRILPDPFVRAENPAGSLEIVAHADDDTAWLFLINHSGEQLNENGWAWTILPVSPLDITVEIRDPRGRTPRLITQGNLPIPWQDTEGTNRVPMKMDTIWKILRISWK